jgi:tetratricopeptide (TPR) repeat protein
MNSPIHNGSLEADKMFFTADQMVANGQIAEATDLLLKLVEKFPSYGRAYNHLGYLYENKYKDVVTAEKFYKLALSHSPEYPATYVNYAVILSAQERFPELTALLNKALEVLGITKDKVYNEFGLMYELQGKYDEAMGMYRKAISYAMNEKDLEFYDKSIKRCNLKMSYL